MGKIGIDGRSLFYGGGTQNYIYNLTKHLADLTTDHEFVLYTQERGDGSIYNDLKEREITFRWVDSPKILWEQLAIPAQVRNDELDLYHSTKSNAPLLLDDVIQISTFHGMDFRAKMDYYTLPEKLRPGTLLNFSFWEIMARLSAATADHIITISDVAKRQIIEYYSIDETKITTVHLAAGEEYDRRARDRSDVLSEYDLSTPYILCVSKYSKKKNVESVLRSLQIVLEAYPEIRVALVGKWDKRYRRRIVKLADDLGVRDRIRFLGYVPETRLPAFYANALLFFYPSVYEGFGIPLVEAMKCGTPILTSNRGAIPEITDEAGIKLDPGDFRGFAEEIKRIYADPAYREQLTDAGRSRGQEFSWEKTARETLAIYERYL